MKTLKRIGLFLLAFITTPLYVLAFPFFGLFMMGKIGLEAYQARGS
jgi:hypothetical protein